MERMRWAQTLALRLLLEAEAAIDTHQLRFKMAAESDRYWSYGHTHQLLKRMEKGGLVRRQKPRDGSVSSWVISERGRTMVEATL